MAVALLWTVVAKIDDNSSALRATVALALVASGPVVVYLGGGYLRSRRPLGNLPIEFGRLLSAAGFSVWLAAVLIQASGGAPKISSLTSIWCAIVAGWLAGRLLASRRRRKRPERTLLVGSGTVAEHVVQLSRRHPEHGVRIVGMVDDVVSPVPNAPPILGTIADLPNLVGSGEFDRVIVAFSDAVDDRMLAQTLRISTPRGVRVDVVPRLFQLMAHDANIEALGDMSLVQVGAPTTGLARRAAKRAFDIVVASFGLLAAAPVMTAVAVAIRLESPGPVLFKQTRIGRGGKAFQVYKFRSMHQDADRRTRAAAAAAAADAAGAPALDVAMLVAELKSEDDARITRVGHVIRRSSLDELPQLWNVLRGDMSLVGPRPLRPFEAAALHSWQDSRHELRPGLTGLWQVLGRSDIDWEQRMQMDYSYVRHWSLRQDLRVLARTLKVVISGRGSR